MPSVHEGSFLDALQKSACFVTERQCRNFLFLSVSRARAITNNPLPSVIEYINIIYNHFTILLGVRPECSLTSTQCTRPHKTVYYKKSKKSLKIGIPKETAPGERRVAASPCRKPTTRSEPPPRHPRRARRANWTCKTKTSDE